MSITATTALFVGLGAVVVGLVARIRKQRKLRELRAARREKYAPHFERSQSSTLAVPGRQSGEFSFVYVKDNKFLGYGYYELNHQIKTKHQIESRLIPIEDNLDLSLIHI